MELAGTVLVHDIQPANAKAEVGYWLRTSAVGHGYATEAAHRVLTYLLTERGFARVEVRCDAANARGIAVAERLGLARDRVDRAGGGARGGTLAGTIVFAAFADRAFAALPALLGEAGP